MSESRRYSSQEQALRGRIGALVLHATHDPRETTLKARQTFAASFLTLVDPDGVLEPLERQRRAEYARKAHYARLAFKSALTRSKKKRDAGPGTEPASAEIVAGGEDRARDQQLEPR